MRTPTAAGLAWVALAVSLSLGASATAVQADRETLEIVVWPREPRPDVFVLKGRVLPDYRKGEAILQRRNCGSCAWFASERFRTDRDSRFRLRIPTPSPGARKTCYRVKVPGSAEYRRALSTTHCLGAPIAATANG